MEPSGRFNCVLTCERVRHQKCFIGPCDARNIAGFGHHLFVNAGSPGRIKEHNVIAAQLGRLQRPPSDFCRALILDNRQRAHSVSTLIGENGQLFHRGGTPSVQ